MVAKNLLIMYLLSSKWSHCFCILAILTSNEIFEATEKIKPDADQVYWEHRTLLDTQIKGMYDGILQNAPSEYVRILTVISLL